LLPLVADRDGRRALELAARLRSDGGVAVLSAPRRGPEDLAGALREAGLLFELALEPNPVLQANEETIRLLVGILLRDPEALRRLQALTVAELERYDEVHDTGLIATLEGFLAHHGSTTETAEAMNLHRHTVGYRLARVQEVSGLSPYESDGRERLSLGLKAHRILQAEERWLARSQAV
jgi:DNA-binding PucR family transcriptional regulator